MGVKVVKKSGRKDWYLQVCVGGRRYLRHVGGRDAAYAAKKDIETALATGAFVPPKAKDAEGRVLFRDAIGRWKKEHIGVNLKPSTKEYYGFIIDEWLLPMFGGMEVAAITRGDVKAAVASWKEEKEKESAEEASPAADGKKARKRKAGQGLRSIPNVLRAMRSFFSWAIEEELAQVNPAKAPSRIYKVESPFRGDYLRPEEVPAYLDGVRKKAPRHLALFRTLIFTGPRIGEAIGLQWGDIDWRGKFITFQRSSWRGNVTSPKTASSVRQVQLSKEMIETLKEHRKSVNQELAEKFLKAGKSMPERVFVNEEGNPIDEAKVRAHHRAALRAAGLRTIRIHDLRGTFASLLVSAGVPLFHVSKALGHSSQETTMRHYAHLAPGAAKEMPNILERYVFGDLTGRDANGARTTEVAAEASEIGGV